MNRYLNFNSVKGFGYQTIARNSNNQTFYFRPLFPNMVDEFEFSLWFKSDLNYQLAVM